MVNVLRVARTFFKDCRGATAAEYALVLAVIATGLTMSAFVLGDTIAASMSNSSKLIQQAGCTNNGQGTGLGGGNGSGGGRGGGNGAGNSC